VVMAPSPYCCPSPRDPPVRSHDRVPMGRERNTGHRSDIYTRSEICAQRASMIPRVPSQDLVHLRKCNDSRHPNSFLGAAAAGAGSTAGPPERLLRGLLLAGAGRSMRAQSRLADVAGFWTLDRTTITGRSAVILRQHTTPFRPMIVPSSFDRQAPDHRTSDRRAMRRKTRSWTFMSAAVTACAGSWRTVPS
jgi:hypothetical protein